MKLRITHFNHIIFSLLLVSILVLTACEEKTTRKDATAATSNDKIENGYYHAPVDIDLSSDRKLVHVNLVRFTGKIPIPQATILINDKSVVNDGSGDYYVFLDLKPGQNLIEIKTTTGTKTKLDKITVIFVPPLVVHLLWPSIDYYSLA